MTTFSEIWAALRRRSLRQYMLLAGCCFFSVLLITTYVCMMRSPTVLTVLPEGGDSRKQVMMIFVLAVVGCGVFTSYASGLFFRHKSREAGIFLALGATRAQLRRALTGELALLALLSCAGGAVLGAPVAFVLWRLFRLFLVDTEEMSLRFDLQAYWFALAFSVFVIATLFWMLARFIKRTNILDVVNESRKSEPIRDVPRWYGPVGIGLLVAGALLGYLAPSFFILGLRWYPPEGLTSLFYAPVFFGLYMILLHTVVNGWRQGVNRYSHIITTSMMKFQGRQTVRNMLVIAVLVAGAFFASFYTPMIGTGAMMEIDARKTDYSFHYRADQDMPDEAEIRALAQQHGVVLTSYTAQPAAILGIDGLEFIEKQGDIGTSYERVYRPLNASNLFLSESAYNALAGESIDLSPGTVTAVYNDEGDSIGRMSNDVTLVTNALTGETLTVASVEPALRCAQLFGLRVMDDADYARITAGLPDDWREEQVFFNVENALDTYDFAKALFNTLIDRSGPEVEVFDAWDPVHKALADQAGEPYRFDAEHIEQNGWEQIDFAQRDSSDFRMYWKYMPQFRVLDRADFVKTTAVFLMLFIFISILCFAAVFVIAYTRSLTIAMTNAHVYEDLRRLGAANSYLLHTVRAQISKVFFSPILTGTCIIYAFYMMILFFNDNQITASEAAGFFNCVLLTLAISGVIYAFYRLTLRHVCGALGIRLERSL